MKCLEFIQMHGNWPVSKRTVEGRFQISGWKCSEPEAARGWGLVLPAFKALAPVRVALRKL